MSNSLLFFSETELEIGRVYAEQKIGYTVDLDMLGVLARDIRERYERMQLWAAMRFSLNEHCIWNDRKTNIPKREAYKSALGKIFAERRATQARADSRDKGRKLQSARRRNKNPEVAVDVNKKGQYIWGF